MSERGDDRPSDDGRGGAGEQPGQPGWSPAPPVPGRPGPAGPPPQPGWQGSAQQGPAPQGPGQQGPGQQGPGQQGGWPGQQGWSVPPQQPGTPPRPPQPGGQQGPPPGPGRPGQQQPWGGREETRQFGAVPGQQQGPPAGPAPHGQQGPQGPLGQPGQPSQPGQPGQWGGPSSPPPAGAWSPSSGQPAPWAAQPAKRSRKKPLLIGGAALLVLLLVAGGAFFFLRGGDFTYAGRDVVEPETVLTDAESAVDAYVDSRGGASSDDTSCWFRHRNADTTDIEDDLVCGPVLFVDGDPAEAYLLLPVTPSGGDGDVTLTVATEPTDPAPQALPDADLLSRPDGTAPPSEVDLEPPAPPAAEPGYEATGPFEDVELTAPEGVATLSGPAARVTVTGLGQADRVGAGDDALRPADGEVFRVFSYTIDTGEGLSNDPPALSYSVDGVETPVDTSLVVPGATVEGLVSAPEDADVALVVVDGEATQSLSLLDGSPGDQNLVVTTRANRDADPVPAQQVPGVISAPGRVTTPFTFTVTVQSAELTWFSGTNVTVRPSAPDRAFLLIDTDLVADGLSAGEGPAEYWRLTLPDGTVVASQDVVADPSLIATAFDVPADFTTGTLTFGGVFTYPDTATVDFGAATLSFPVSIPAG
ncbi:hypothetical protein [Modestobacter sp. Leaf380]|uniref:hypothetical protein n=1 Tax=Modestobacter sp. Leaf380 TaxID=1736356 RepID=UPI0006F61607|nr:hypothetical protein [Modestobacter sp. Leaf380]KQS73712.1 hypothetical protein ASG41_03720 [Modestobacter sp. Leaf380]